MRLLVKEFVEICTANFNFPEPVYEFGALQVEGQEGFADIRPFFKGKEYIGTDFRQGKGVDLILDLHSIDLPDSSIGSALLLETLEHVEYARKAMEQVRRVMRPDGIVIITSLMRFKIHSYPNDYWRFTPEGFKSLLSPFSNSFVSYAGNPEFPHTVVGIGFAGSIPSIEEFERDIKQWQQKWSSENGRIKPSFSEKWANSFRKRYQEFNKLFK